MIPAATRTLGDFVRPVVSRLLVARVLVAATASVPVAVLLTSPAFAANRDDGDNPGPGLTVPETLLWFVVVPGAVIAVIWLAVLAASWSRTPRYRPGLPWSADPLWINGPAPAPAQGPAQVPAAGPAASVESLVQDPAASGANHAVATSNGLAEPLTTGGGARARW